MIFELLRTHKVDVMRYLPKFLKKDEQFTDVQNALSIEHERYRLLLIDMMKQFFVETVTWGIGDWERVYGINPRPGDSLEERRERLKYKILNNETITLKSLNDMINSVVPKKDARLIENVEDGVIRIEMDTAINLDEVRRIVKENKPAHLTCLIAKVETAYSQLSFGATVSIQSIETIPVATSDDIITANKPNIIVGATVAVVSISELK